MDLSTVELSLELEALREESLEMENSILAWIKLKLSFLLNLMLN